MNVCEIRDLDGPNIFLRMPAIKLEVASEDGDFQVSRAALAFSLGEPVADTGMEAVDPERLMTLITEVINVLHDRSGQARPQTASRAMEDRHHYSVAVTWTHRRFALTLGELALQIVMGKAQDIEGGIASLTAIKASPAEEDDAPEMVTRAENAIPIIAITGTNGKTTTSRLISFILRNTGKVVGLTSSAGVYIDTEQIVAGDYSGPSGAHRVLVDDRVEVAVLETARGGMLLRGLGYEESDVSVVTNVSADHLGLHGVHSLEGLAEVKSLVPRMTREGGFAVLNADDPLVLAMREQVRARPFLVSRLEMSDEMREHIANGGWALTVDDGQVHWWHDGTSDVLTSLSDIPVTFGGRAPHMVENALCAAAACLGIGLFPDQVRAGLAAFRSTARDNHGRLNVYTLNGATLVIDFAHNEAGLRKLLEFARQFREGHGTVTAIVGTAGDREDDVFRALGQVAAEQADVVIKKDTTKYLRGRHPGEMLRLMEEGVRKVNTAAAVENADSEREACLRAFERAREGDVVAVMCIEDYDFLLKHLDEVATPVS
jgi:cyanophycin synthetase